MSSLTVSAGQREELVPAGTRSALGSPSGSSKAHGERSGGGFADGGGTREAVTVMMGVVVGLTFMFGFGNVLSLGLRLGVSGWIAPLVAPAIDLSVLALLVATRHLALSGASVDELRPARRLLLLAGEWGKAAFDAVGPLLLIGWAHVGLELLYALSAALQYRLPHVTTVSLVDRTIDVMRRTKTVLHLRQFARVLR